MAIDKIFTIITNLFGLNFVEPKVPLSVVLFLNVIVVNVAEVVNIYYAFLVNNSQMKPIYAFIDFIQLGWPLVMKNFFMLRAIRMRSFDAQFETFVLKTYELSNLRKNKEKFFIYVAICTSIFMTKMALGTSEKSVIYNASHLITTIVNATSDFIFVYQILCLRDHVKSIRETKCDVREESLKVIEIKRLIHHRFSINLTLSVATDFFLIIISLYWLFVRIVFHFMKTHEGKSNSNI